MCYNIVVKIYDTNTIMSLIKQLTEYGFSPREAMVYVFLHERIEAPAHLIAKGTAIPRATVYLVLEELKKKGFVASSKKNNVTYFSAESPNQLKAVMQEKLSLAELLIPQLRSLVHTKNFSPTMKMYEGTAGLKTAFEDVLETLEQKKFKRLYSIADNSLLDVLPKYLPEWIKRREKLGVFTQMITEGDQGRVIYHSNTLREVRRLPKDTRLDCTINIYGDKIICTSVHQKEIYSVIIDSPTIVATIKQLFLLVWSSLSSNKTDI